MTLALDDFGSGHSSLGYLQRFPIDVVKIDPVLVSGLASNRASPAIIAAVVGLTGVLGMTVRQKVWRRPSSTRPWKRSAAGSCQGFYFADPMSANDIEVLMQLRRDDGCGLRLPVLTA